MKQGTEACGGRSYAAGDVVKFKIVMDHKPHLKEVRLVFAHESEEHAVIVAKVEPHPRLDIAAKSSRRSNLVAEITIPAVDHPEFTDSSGSATRPPEVGWDT